MGFPFFPFTNFHEINMDWIIKFIKKAKQDLATAKAEIDEAVATVEGYGERLEGAEEDINRLETENTAQNTAITNLDDRITNVSTGVADLVSHAVQTYDQTEQFTEAEKAQARTNIGAVALSAYNTNNNRVNSILEYQGNQISALAPMTFTLNDSGTWPAQSIPEANRAAIILAKNTLVNKTTLVYATINQQTYQELPSRFIVAMVCVGDNILSGTFEQAYYDGVHQEYGTVSATITVDTVHWTWDMSYTVNSAEPAPYVTPEMYGASGDGVADDTQAIQNAINNAEGRTVYFSNKTYKTTNTVYLTKNPIINEGVISYTGTGYALTLAPTVNIDGAYYNLGVVNAPNGSCLRIDSTSAWLQYITFVFQRLTASATGKCVFADVVGSKWINEIRFEDGRFYGGLDAVYIDHTRKTGSGMTSHWTFDKVGFEGITNGVNIPDMVTRMSFINCRAEESITNAVYSRAQTNNASHSIEWYGAIANGAYWKDCINYTVLFSSGYIDAGGTIITYLPIVFNNGMLYGLRFDCGQSASDTDYNAYSYDETTNIQEVDFAKVYNYSVSGYRLLARPYTRRFTISNNTNAAEMNIYLDERMFLDNNYGTINSFLLLLTLSPNKIIKIYNKNSGTLLQTITGTNVTTYPRLVVSCAKNIYYIEQKTISYKQV